MGSGYILGKHATFGLAWDTMVLKTLSNFAVFHGDIVEHGTLISMSSHMITTKNGPELPLKS